MPSLFSLDKCAKKRPSDDAAEGKAKTIRAGDVVVEPLVSRLPSSRPTHGPVIVCIYKWTDNAGDVLPAYEGRKVALYQIQDIIFTVRP